MTPRITVLDYGSGNLRSVERALQHVGADVTVTADHEAALNADGLLVPGVGAFAACMAGLKAVRGDHLVDARLAGGRPVLGICVGLQILFDAGAEFPDGEHAGTDGAHPQTTAGCGQWPGTVERLHAEVLPHMGWNTVRAAADSALFAGIDPVTRFYFVHSYGVRRWEMEANDILAAPKVSWAHHGEHFIAAVENGPLWATQFHPEKSGEAGAAVLRNWLESL